MVASVCYKIVPKLDQDFPTEIQQQAISIILPVIHALHFSNDNRKFFDKNSININCYKFLMMTK